MYVVTGFGGTAAYVIVRLGARFVEALPDRSSTSKDAVSLPGGTPDFSRSTVHDHVPAALAFLALQPANDPDQATLKATPEATPTVEAVRSSL